MVRSCSKKGCGRRARRRSAEQAEDTWRRSAREIRTVEYRVSSPSQVATAQPTCGFRSTPGARRSDGRGRDRELGVFLDEAEAQLGLAAHQGLDQVLHVAPRRGAGSPAPGSASSDPWWSPLSWAGIISPRPLKRLISGFLPLKSVASSSSLVGVVAGVDRLGPMAEPVERRQGQGRAVARRGSGPAWSG